MKIHTNAPGKLVLLGEYAVLFGAPALVAAINRRAHVTVENSDSQYYVVSAPGFLREKISFFPAATADGAWRHQLPLLAHALDSFGGSIRSPLKILLDTTEFFHPSKPDRPKLGLGSSAALSVALLGAMENMAKTDKISLPDLTELLKFHNSLQGGEGSGIDIAASLLGGCLRYQLDPDSGIPTAKALELPKDLHIIFVFTGHPADTGIFLSALRKTLDSGSVAAEKALKSLADLSADGLKEIESGGSSRLPALVDDFGEALEELGRCIGLPVFSEDHRRLRRLAWDFGIAYKPSGAGGGDFGMAVSLDQDQLLNFEKSANQLGYETPPIRIDHQGLDIHRVLDARPSPRDRFA